MAKKGKTGSDPIIDKARELLRNENLEFGSGKETNSLDKDSNFILNKDKWEYTEPLVKEGKVNLRGHYSKEDALNTVKKKKDKDGNIQYVSTVSPNESPFSESYFRGDMPFYDAKQDAYKPVYTEEDEEIENSTMKKDIIKKGRFNAVYGINKIPESYFKKHGYKGKEDYIDKKLPHLKKDYEDLLKKEQMSDPKKGAQGLSEGGVVVGEGTGKSDSIEGELDKGDFVIPADAPKYVTMFLMQELGIADIADLEGDIDVKLSNGEIVIPKEQISQAKEILKKLGLTLDDLAPNAEKQEGNEYAYGSFVEDNEEENNPKKAANQYSNANEEEEEEKEEENKNPSLDDPETFMGNSPLEQPEQDFSTDEKDSPEIAENQQNRTDFQNMPDKPEKEQQQDGFIPYEEWEKRYNKHNPVGAYIDKLKPTIDKERKENHENLARWNSIGDALKSIGDIVVTEGAAPIPNRESTAKSPLATVKQMEDQFKKKKRIYDKMKYKQNQNKFDQYLKEKQQYRQNKFEEQKQKREFKNELTKEQLEYQNNLKEEKLKGEYDIKEENLKGQWDYKIQQLQNQGDLQKSMLKAKFGDTGNGMILTGDPKTDENGNPMGFEAVGRIPTEEGIVTAFNQIVDHPKIRDAASNDVQFLKAKFGGNIGIDEMKTIVQKYWEDFSSLEPNYAKNLAETSNDFWKAYEKQAKEQKEQAEQERANNKDNRGEFNNWRRDSTENKYPEEEELRDFVKEDY